MECMVCFDPYTIDKYTAPVIFILLTPCEPVEILSSSYRIPVEKAEYKSVMIRTLKPPALKIIALRLSISGDLFVQ